MASKKTKKTKPKRKQAPGRRGAHQPPSHASGLASESDHTRLVADWAATRAGARAARGFHFQDLVGAWLASRIAAGELGGELVPEGFDDLSIEGAPSTNFQVKSRQDRLGPFPLPVAAAHVLDAWAANDGREQSAERLVVVLERGVADQLGADVAGNDPEVAIHASSPLGQALTREAQRRGLSEATVSALASSTSVVGVSWDQVETLVDEQLAAVVPRVATEGRRLIARSLTALVAGATDHNAAAGHADRTLLDRSKLVERIHRDAEQIDVEGLEKALRDGLCELLDYTAPAGDTDRFYEGEAAQPSHVAAGLVSPRPDLVAEVLAATDASQPVLLKGPSGVGKSAVLWTIPLAMRGVLWFRVRRLESHGDAVALVRLARAHGASADQPVGFLVDGAGAGRVRAWSELRGQVEGREGIVLVATVRNEDLLELGDLAGCATVAVSLGEAAAESIYEGLVRRGVTEAPYWREAYEKAEGLTLEFTHILSRGRRLRDVIDDQISTRIREGRTTELDLLALVSVAHRWSASLDVVQVSSRLGDAAVRPAVERLVDEHLLVEVQGVLSGLHPLRSEAISESVHATPPPTWSMTVEGVLELLEDDQLPRFISQVLRDLPDLEPVLVQFGLDIADRPRRVARVLEGLRLFDGERQIRAWLEIQDEEGVFPSAQLMVTLLAMAGTDMGDMTPAPVASALARMASVQAGDARAALIEGLGEARLRRLLLSAQPADASVLLAALGGSAVNLTASTSDDPTVLLDQLLDEEVDDVADLLAAARNCSETLAMHLVDRLGGESAMLDLLRSRLPWLLEVGVRVDGPDRVGHARLLHVSDEVHEGAHDRVVHLARVLLRTLPSIDRTDVKVLLPGGQPYIIGGLELGATGLVRPNDHDQAKVRWNRARMAIARSLVGESDSTRLANAANIVRDLTALVRDFGNRWVRRDFSQSDSRRLVRELERLSDAGHQMRPALVRDPGTNDRDDRGDSGGGDLFGFINQITDNAMPRLVQDNGRPALIAFLAETILPGIAQAENEPWHLLGDSASVVESLRLLAEAIERIESVLRQQELGSVAAGDALRTARAASRSTALAAAARPAEEGLATNLESRRSSLESALATSQRPPASLLAERRDGIARFALVMELPSIFRWAAELEGILRTIQAHRTEHEQFLIVPTRAGLRLKGVGCSLIQTPMPTPDVGPWAERLPAARETPLADCIDRAVSSLQWLSGLNDLRPDQSIHPAIASLEARARATHRAAVEELESISADALREHAVRKVGEWRATVEAEVPGNNVQPTFAATCMGALLGVPNVLVDGIGELRSAAIEWEIDPEIVRQRYGW